LTVGVAYTKRKANVSGYTLSLIFSTCPPIRSRLSVNECNTPVAATVPAAAASAMAAVLAADVSLDYSYNKHHMMINDIVMKEQSLTLDSDADVVVDGAVLLAIPVVPLSFYYHQGIV
jgi:hypothetical protein